MVELIKFFITCREIIYMSSFFVYIFLTMKFIVTKFLVVSNKCGFYITIFQIKYRKYRSTILFVIEENDGLFLLKNSKAAIYFIALPALG